LLDRSPVGSRVVLAGRSIQLPLARLRASGRLVELDQEDLALTEDEAGALLRAAGVDIPAADVAELERRTEGWAAGLYLAAVSLRAGRGRPAVETFGGDDRYVADYLREELLASLSEDQVRFMTRTSVLDRMSGPLCDAVLGTRGSTVVLQTLEDANRLLVPLDRTRTWYRYHHLLRDLLRAELERREPDAAAGLALRAADWWEAQGDLESAVEYLHVAGAMERLAELLALLTLPMYAAGRKATLDRWFGWFDEAGLPERFPPLAVAGAWFFALGSDLARAHRWADAAERGVADETSGIDPWMALLRSMMGRSGIDAMHADACIAVATIPGSDPWAATSRVILGMTHVLRGETAEADACLAEAVDLAAANRNGMTAVFALSVRAALAIDRADRSRAELLIVQAHAMLDEFHLEDYLLSLPLHAVSARLALHRGDVDRARDHLTEAQRLRPQLSELPSWLAMVMLIELARSHLALGDGSGARTLLREFADIRGSHSDLHVLDLHVEEIRRKLEALPLGHVGESALTAAELRLLPYLSTHLTFREIGARLFVSPNTVKTQAISIYRKLSVSSRSEAVVRAQEVGLIEG
jgi:LuxR family maltose regulon positive regulatory protein